MPDLPEKKQSIRSPRSLLLAALAALVVLVAVWFAVSAAVSWGGDDCPTKPETGEGWQPSGGPAAQVIVVIPQG